MMRARGFACVFALQLAALFLPASQSLADFVGHGAPVRDIVISSDGKHALTAGFDDQAILWDVGSRELLQRLLGHEAAVNAAAFVPPDDRRAVTASDDGTLRLWRLDDGAELAVWRGHKAKVVAVAVSPDGRYAASGSWDRTVRLWDIQSGEELARYEGHEGSVNAVVFLPQGQGVVSAGYDGALWLWPLPGGSGAARLAKIGFPIGEIALSPDGTELLTGSADGYLRLWDWQARREIAAQKGHEGAVLTVAFASDGSFASGGTDGRVLLWDAIASATPRRTVEIDHYRAVWSLAFSPDAELVFTAGTDPVARAWYVESGESLIGESTPYQPIARASPAAAESDDPVQRGSYQFRKCAVCHSLTEDGVLRAGPSLEGLFGRRIGSYPGYLYSDALRNSDLIWNEETVGKLFELGPDVFLPGTKMPLQKLPDAQARADLIAFLKAETRPH
jgi:cytochrome c